MVVMIILLWAACHVLSTSVPCTNCDGNNVTCVDGVCPPRCVNVTSSGECLQCLDSRFYGKQCERDCPDTCLNSRCQMNNYRVVCTEGCVDGKKGDDCYTNCPTSCRQCERYGNGCTGPCQNPQYYGQHCRTLCPSNCAGGCNRTTGECGSCEPGYTGVKCDVTCPPNCRGGCNRITGECGSCEPGYRGDKCDVTCPPNCRGGCDKDTGVCVSCKVGYTGKHCDSCETGYRGKHCNSTCPTNCRDCDRETGECILCVEGYCKGGCDEKGDNCNSTSCKTTCRANCIINDFSQNQCSGPCINTNFYGKICTTPCPDKCDKCEKDSARCYKCAPGLKGERCNESCPSDCLVCDRFIDVCIGACRDPNYHGGNCSTPCPVSCDGCDKDTGGCINCAQGYSRTYCDEVCSPCVGDACHRLPCKTRPSDHTLVISIGSVAGVLCCVILLHIFKRRITRVPCSDGSSRNYSDSVAHRYWEIDVNQVSGQPDRAEESVRPTLPLTERPRVRAPGSAPSDGQGPLSDTLRPTPGQYKPAGSDPELVDSAEGNCVAGEPSLSLVAASALSGNERDSLYQSFQSDTGIPFSDEIQRMTERTDSIIFIEENCDLSAVSVRYLTANKTDRDSASDEK